MSKQFQVMPCSTCSKTAKVIQKIHRYERTDKVGDWYICDTCGVTATCYPNRKAKNE